MTNTAAASTAPGSAARVGSGGLPDRIDVIVVIDGFGIGAAGDAGDYLTSSANTAAHIAETVGGLNLVVLGAWGLGNLTNIAGVRPTPQPAATCRAGVMSSAGNDTPAGHWELLGRPSTTPAATYPNGFDTELLDELCAAWGVEHVLANTAIGGLEVLAEHGDEHVAGGAPIVYTSTDSVLQIAAHVDVTTIEEQWARCETARRICDARWPVGRIIARPFTGTSGHWERLSGSRRDWATPAPADGALDRLHHAGVTTIGIGKIGDIFDHRSLSRELHPEGLDATFTATRDTITELAANGGGVIVTNIAETDYRGHARDTPGYAATLEQIDERLGELAGAIRCGDTIVVCADHGNDPTHTTDDTGNPHLNHTREHTPILTRTIGTPGSHLAPTATSSVGIDLCERWGINSTGLGQETAT